MEGDVPLVVRRGMDAITDQDRGAVRIAIWGALAMGVSFVVGRLIGAVAL